MSVNKFEDLLRPIYEINAAVIWAFAGLWLFVICFVVNVPRETMLIGAAMGIVMMLYRAVSARRLINYKMSLAGKDVTLMSTVKLKNNLHKLDNNLWLGWGYHWEPVHTQRAYDTSKRNLEDIYPPKWWYRYKKTAFNPYLAKGVQWIHGLGMKERDVLLPFESLKGHCAVIATTGAIKTRLAALIIFQLALRGDCVVVIDPKGDKDLRNICKEAAEFAGHPERFLMLHSAFASESVRLDLVKNWDQVSQVASRITMVLDGQGSDNFKEFCWMAVHRITNGMKYVGRRVSLYTLKTAMESRASVERMTELALRKFFTEECPQLLEEIEKEVNIANAGGKKPGKPAANVVETNSPVLTAMIKVFQAKVPETAEEVNRTGCPLKPEEVRGLVSILEANKEWFGKMIISITPLLTKLTTDDLRGLLSPDYEDENDTRPILDGKKMVEGNHILYIGTDTLADESVGRAMSTMVLAELSSVAAEIYNHGLDLDTGEQPRRVHVVVDEWGDAACAPLIQQANKGRGAGFFIWAMGQTFSDLVDKFDGNAPRARRFIGNMNNLIVGATHDSDTMQLIVDKLGETSILVKGQSSGIGSKIARRSPTNSISSPSSM
jgi:conjugal transfer pilus assembly protein TraD